MQTVTLNAYAKVNLGLDVVGKTENGYHLLRTVMQQVDLYDVITMEKLPGQTGKILLETGSDEIPCDSSNLAYKAAESMMQLFALRDGVRIRLDKRIPVAAGMAGGSTDGAAVLKGMNQLFELGCSQERLMEIGVKLGADVPFCVMGNTALAEGIGEKLTPLTVIPEMTLLITKPKLNVSTKYVYQNLHLDTVTHPDTDGILEAMKSKDLTKMISCMSNVLESVTGAEYPIIGQLEQSILQEGADGAIMSGSGPTVFGIFADKETAIKAQKAIADKYPDIFVKAVGVKTAD